MAGERQTPAGRGAGPSEPEREAHEAHEGGARRARPGPGQVDAAAAALGRVGQEAGEQKQERGQAAREQEAPGPAAPVLSRLLPYPQWVLALLELARELGEQEAQALERAAEFREVRTQALALTRVELEAQAQEILVAAWGRARFQTRQAAQARAQEARAQEAWDLKTGEVLEATRARARARPGEGLEALALEPEEREAQGLQAQETLLAVRLRERTEGWARETREALVRKVLEIAQEQAAAAPPPPELRHPRVDILLGSQQDVHALELRIDGALNRIAAAKRRIQRM